VIPLTPLVELLRNVRRPQPAAPTPIDLTSTSDSPDDSAHSESRFDPPTGKSTGMELAATLTGGATTVLRWTPDNGPARRTEPARRVSEPDGDNPALQRRRQESGAYRTIETLVGGRRAHGRGASVVAGDVEQAADRRYDDDAERRIVQPGVSASIRLTASPASGISWISVWMPSAERR
jgi:hypothetical protein